MRALLFALIALVLAGVAAIALAPVLIDPAEHKQALAQRLAAATGGRVAIDGAVGFETLPRPALTLESVRLTPPGADAAGGADLEVRVATLRVELRARPLLRGEVQVAQAVLVAPEARIAASAGPAADPRALLARLRAWGVARVRVERGRLAIPAPAGGAIHLREITAELRRAGAAAGAFEAEGTLRAGAVAGLPLAFRLRLGADTGGDARPYSLRLGPADGTTNGAALPALSLSGRMATAGPFRAEGRLEVTAARSEALPAGPARRLAAWLGTSGTTGLRLAGDLTITPAEAVLAGLDLRLGGVQARGRAELAFAESPRLRAELHVPRLDLDSRLAAAGAGPPDLAAWTPAALPERWRGRLDLTAGAMVYRNRVLRDLTLEARLADAAVEVVRLDARLPGSSTLRLSGTARVPEPHTPSFAGRIAARSDNLRTVVDWLGLDVSGVSPERLRRLDGTGRIEARPGRLAVTGLDLTLDTMTVQGGVIAALRARPGFGIGLRLDRLDLDGYVAPEADGGVVAKRLRGLLGAVDANLDLSAETVVYGGRSFRDLHLDGTLDHGRLTLRRVRAAGVAGGTLSLDGSLDPVTAAAPTLDLNLAWQEAAVAAAADLLGAEGGWAQGDWVEDLGRFDLSGQLAGAPRDLSVDLDLRALGGRAQLRGQVARPDAGLRVDLDTSLAHESLRGLLAALPGAPRPDRALGGLDLSARLHGGREALIAEGFGGKLGPVQISGRLEGAFDGPRPKLVARLETGTLPLPLLLGWMPRPEAAATVAGDEAGAESAGPGGAPWAAAPLDLGLLKATDAELTLDSRAVTLAPGLKLDAARLDATLAAGRLRVRDLAGTLLGGRAQADLVLDTAGTPTLELSAEAADLDPGALPARLRGKLDLGGRLDLSLSARAQGASEAALADSLAGTAQVSGALRLGMAAGAETGLLRHLLGARAAGLARRDAAEARLQAAFGAAPGPLSGSVRAEAGVLRSDDLSLEGRGLVATAEGALDLADWRVDAGVAVAQRAGAAPGETPERLGVRLVGRLGAPALRLEGRPADLLAAAAEPPGGEAPRIETPTVETPQVEAPTIETPTVESPTVDSPQVDSPEIQAPRNAGSGDSDPGESGSGGGLRSAEEIIEDLLRDDLRD